MSDSNINSEYTISNGRGTIKATFISIGASLKNLYVIDKNGGQQDIVLGLPLPSDYIDNNLAYFGCVVGRVAGRIKDGHFKLDGKTYQLDSNNGTNCLHGGKIGYSHKPWNLIDQSTNSVKFQLISPNGDNGFPGTLRVTIEYIATDSDELSLNYEAQLINDDQEKDIPSTIINLTNHTYFNLTGFSNPNEKTILDHIVQTHNCSQVLDKDETLTANGTILNVDTVPAMDFKQPKTIGHSIGLTENGYDDCFIVSGYDGVDGQGGTKCVPAITVHCPSSGIKLSMSTTEPAYQFYTGNFITAAIKTKSYPNSPELRYDKQYGFCLEAQRPPNAINIQDWEKYVILKRGQIYKQKTIYSFAK